MNVDYRLLHHFRVSQRRELALRGALPEQWRDELVETPPAERARSSVSERARPVYQVHLFTSDDR